LTIREEKTVFDTTSRYAKTQIYSVTDHRGRQVSIVAVPDAPTQGLLGYHVLRQGQRVDHLAAHYLNDPTGFWRICEENDVMLPEALSEAPEIAIPTRAG
jgi:hypothetical protein